MGAVCPRMLQGSGLWAVGVWSGSWSCYTHPRTCTTFTVWSSCTSGCNCQGGSIHPWPCPSDRQTRGRGPFPQNSIRSLRRHEACSPMVQARHSKPAAALSLTFGRGPRHSTTRLLAGDTAPTSRIGRGEEFVPRRNHARWGGRVQRLASDVRHVRKR